MRKGRSAAFLKKLRRKYHLGEFRRRKGRSRSKAAAKRKYPVRRRRRGAPKVFSPYTPFGKTGGPLTLK